MLVLTRKSGEAIRIGSRIRVVVLSASHGQVRLGIEAPPGVIVLREEVHERIAEANRQAALCDEPAQPEAGSTEVAEPALQPVGAEVSR
jgi:carbon storage regulator